MADTTVFRQEYRKEYIGKRYSGKLHVAFITLWCTSGIALCIYYVHQPTFLQLLTIPLTFIYTNLFEYLGHRYPMHHRTRFLHAVFKRHTLQHHHFFTSDYMDFDTINDFKIVLFPPVLLVFFSVFFVLPIFAVLYYFFSLNVALLYVATTLGYYLNYEWFHMAYHLPQTHLIYKIPGIQALRKLHYRHHDPHNMDKYNFNISYPVFDFIFRTLKR
jgi:hypothetical protein